MTKDSDGVMMYEKRFLAYAQSIEGGGYSYMEAKSKWDAMVATDNHLHDMEGPEPAKLQRWARVENRAKFRSEYTKGRNYARQSVVLRTPPTSRSPRCAAACSLTMMQWMARR